MDSHSAGTRQGILEAAENQFAWHGYEGAHLQIIASQAGVQKTAIYYYFPSKAALYNAVLKNILEHFESVISQVISGSGCHAERLSNLVDAFNDIFAERRNYSKIMVRLFVDSPDVLQEDIYAPVHRLVAQILRFIREGKEQGVFTKASARHFLQSAVGAMIFHYASGTFGAAMLGVEDIFSESAVTWRRRENRSMALRALLREPPADS